MYTMRRTIWIDPGDLLASSRARSQSVFRYILRFFFFFFLPCLVSIFFFMEDIVHKAELGRAHGREPTTNRSSQDYGYTWFLLVRIRKTWSDRHARPRWKGRSGAAEGNRFVTFYFWKQVFALLAKSFDVSSSSRIALLFWAEGSRKATCFCFLSNCMWKKICVFGCAERFLAGFFNSFMGGGGSYCSCCLITFVQSVRKDRSTSKEMPPIVVDGQGPSAGTTLNG